MQEINKLCYKKCNRNSSIESLKFVAMFLIVVSHSLPRYGNYESTIDFSIAVPGLNNLILYILHYFGQIGNAIFIICSAWFLFDSKKVKKEKILHIYLDSFIISIVWLIIICFLGFHVPIKEIIKECLPVFFKNNWFISCYIVLYVLHPALNILIKMLNQKQHLCVVLIMSLVYSVLASIWSQAYYYNEVIGFVTLYIITSYMKCYMDAIRINIKANCVVFTTSLVFLIMLIRITQFLGQHVTFFSNQMLHWESFNNPLIILMGLSLFNLFSQLQIKSFIINEVMSVSLLIYIIHENLLLNETIKPYIWQIIYNKEGYRLIILWILFVSIILFICSVFFALLYKYTFQKIVFKIGEKQLKVFSEKYSKIVDFIITMSRKKEN